ncbi:MAG: NADH:flavin oxidoreductase [Candidatus Omnitrophica bacterium]|nr:NADH:flavin oxidoreductase [Candidatus Omnitrophota bacterium]
MQLFEPIKIGNVNLENRIVRSATFEGMCDQQGFPTEKYFNLYRDLSKNNIGAIITGFAYISSCGRAMHPGQAGIDEDAKISYYKRVCHKVHENGSKIFMQIAHSGRQTMPQAVGGVVKGVSQKKSPYFQSAPTQMSADEVKILIGRFAEAAKRCQESGFDGVQLHAAHGYLIHQFLLPSINDRKDEFGIDRQSRIGTLFLKLIIREIRAKCGQDFPILIKISASDDYATTFTQNHFVQLVRFLDEMRVDAIEISYGTMDCALNIFRGESVPLDTILELNPRYRTRNIFRRFLTKRIIYPVAKHRFKKFTPAYNLHWAQMAKRFTKIPIVCVGGFRKMEDMTAAIENQNTDIVSICRPFICEPDLIHKIKMNESYQAKCLNCNMCAVMCDSGRSTRCYFGHYKLGE